MNEQEYNIELGRLVELFLDDTQLLLDTLTHEQLRECRTPEQLDAMLTDTAYKLAVDSLGGFDV